MSRKQSSYAAKHSAFVPDSQVSFNAFLEQNADLWEVMRHPADFEKQFLDLQYPRQIALIDLFKGIMHNNIVISPAKIKKMFISIYYF